MRGLLFKSIFKLFVFFFTVSYSVLVQSYTSPSPYISVELGGYWYADDTEVATFFGDTGVTERLAVGMLWPISHRIRIGLETGFNHYQDSHGMPLFWEAQGTKKRKGVDALGVFNFSLTKHFDMFIKPGVAYSWYQYEINGTSWWTEEPYTYSGTVRNWRPKVSGGMGYNINKHFAVNLSLNHEFASNWVATGLLGLQYTF
jgi:hypothetical protein